MKFTFGIITAGDAEDRIKEICRSIDEEFAGRTRDYEIIIIGGVKHYLEKDNLLRTPFDESKKVGWITRKKNMITDLARFDNVVYMHDYFRLATNWLDGFETFGDNWDICMNKIVDMFGNRYVDWVYWDKPGIGTPWTCTEKWCKNGLLFDGQAALAPYDETDTSRMYVSGGYWVAKRNFMKRFRLNEMLGHCEGEDAYFSLAARAVWNYRMNTSSIVQLMKPKTCGILDASNRKK